MHRTLTSFQLLWPLDCFSIIHSWQVIRKFYRYCTLIGWVGSLAVRSVLSASSSLLAFSTVWNGPQHKVQGSHEDLLCSPQLVPVICYAYWENEMKSYSCLHDILFSTSHNISLFPQYPHAGHCNHVNVGKGWCLSSSLKVRFQTGILPASAKTL